MCVMNPAFAQCQVTHFRINGGNLSHKYEQQYQPNYDDCFALQISQETGKGTGFPFNV